MALSVTSAIWQQVNSPALDIRRFISSVVDTEGIVDAGDMAVAQRAAGANMSVDIAAGQALVQGDAITNQGMYYAYNDGVVNLTGFSAAHATNPRIDRVCLRLRDAFHGDAANDVAFVVVTGTATSGATLVNLTGAAAVPASHLLLANILIPATATTITTANIDTTVRPRLALVGGGSRLAYGEFTSDVSVTATSEASPNDVVSSDTVTYAAEEICVEFYSWNVAIGTAAQVVFHLWDNTTDLGRIAIARGTSAEETVFARRYLTPTAGPHTYKIRALVNAGTGTVNAGTGGVATDLPGYVRVMRAP